MTPKIGKNVGGSDFYGRKTLGRVERIVNFTPRWCEIV